MTNMIDGKWGGKRANAGRKPKMMKAPPKTKPCRVTHHQCEFIKSGKLNELQNLLYDWKQKMERESGSDTSPRWQRMREFMSEVEDLMGCDADKWIDDVD